MKKVIVFGGGSGLSCLLSGLKLFPLEVTTVIAVSDDGSSTGVLKKEFDIPAVGDIGKVLLSMANVDDDLIQLLGYRFQNAGSTLNNHPIRNILLTALIDLKGNLTEATKYMCRMLNIKGEVLPLTEERAELVGRNEENGEEFFGEVSVSQNIMNISTLSYDRDIHVGNKVKKAIAEADLIIMSPGSLYTSILPHLIAKDVEKAIQKSKAPIMYVSNLVTQPGETDGYNVSDHIKVLNDHLGKRKIDVVVANNGVINPQIIRRYLETENKTLVELDRENIEALGARIIEGDIFCIEDDRIRHKALNTAYRIFAFLMEGE